MQRHWRGRGVCVHADSVGRRRDYKHYLCYKFHVHHLKKSAPVFGHFVSVFGLIVIAAAQ